jgi:beta-phosphoglucomutase-like phosphatase (HAD superfamily)
MIPQGSTRLRAGIFDVDGVLLASPHEQAWREALPPASQPSFTTGFYQGQVAGKPRLAGAEAALAGLGLGHAPAEVSGYAERKQKRLEELIAAGAVAIFPDALRFVQAMADLGWPLAVASSSKNAVAMMRPVRLPSGRPLLDVFGANDCGLDLSRGKPDPEIFLLAALGLGADPAHCVVIEDAPAGIRAARAGQMAALGVARLGDAAGLWAAGADLVVTSLDEVSREALAAGRLAAKERS